MFLDKNTPRYTILVYLYYQLHCLLRISLLINVTIIIGCSYILPHFDYRNHLLVNVPFTKNFRLYKMLLLYAFSAYMRMYPKDQMTALYTFENKFTGYRLYITLNINYYLLFTIKQTTLIYLSSALINQPHIIFTSSNISFTNSSTTQY